MILGCETEPGIVERTLKTIFTSKKTISAKLLRISMLEVYNETLRDLLTKETRQLEVVCFDYICNTKLFPR